MSIRFRSHPQPLLCDLRLLRTRDRAILRIVNRNKAATTQHLTELTRAHPRKIQQRTQLLWQAGYLDRITLPAPARGGSLLAHRLSTTGRRRLGYRDRGLAGIQELQHRLDTLQAVSALSRPLSPSTPYPIQAWLNESAARDIVGPRPQPDAIVVLELPGGSCVLCLEVDRGTQHAPVIRNKLLAYRAALRERRGWHLLFVVPSAPRRRWLQRLVRATPHLDRWAMGWAAELPDVEDRALESRVWPLGRTVPGTRLIGLADDQKVRRCSTPVGSPEWLDLLGSGGGEELGEALR